MKEAAVEHDIAYTELFRPCIILWYFQAHDRHVIPCGVFPEYLDTIGTLVNSAGAVLRHEEGNPEPLDPSATDMSCCSPAWWNHARYLGLFNDTSHFESSVLGRLSRTTANMKCFLPTSTEVQGHSRLPSSTDDDTAINAMRGV